MKLNILNKLFGKFAEDCMLIWCERNFSAHFDGRLSDKKNDRINIYIELSGRCKRAYDSYESMLKILADNEKRELPDGFYERLDQRISEINIVSGEKRNVAKEIYGYILKLWSLSYVRRIAVPSLIGIFAVLLVYSSFTGNFTDFQNTDETELQNYMIDDTIEEPLSSPSVADGVVPDEVVPDEVVPDIKVDKNNDTVLGNIAPKKQERPQNTPKPNVKTPATAAPTPPPANPGLNVMTGGTQAEDTVMMRSASPEAAVKPKYESTTSSEGVVAPFAAQQSTILQEDIAESEATPEEAPQITVFQIRTSDVDNVLDVMQSNGNAVHSESGKNIVIMTPSEYHEAILDLDYDDVNIIYRGEQNQEREYEVEGNIKVEIVGN